MLVNARFSAWDGVIPHFMVTYSRFQAFHQGGVGISLWYDSSQRGAC